MIVLSFVGLALVIGVSAVIGAVIALLIMGKAITDSWGL